ncbi:hypothetical protein, partial [Bacillus cereus group sp. BC232]
DQLGDEDSQVLGFIAGVVSVELAKGHICLPLWRENPTDSEPLLLTAADFSAKLGLFGDAALVVNQQLQAINWLGVLQRSSLVGQQGEA